MHPRHLSPLLQHADHLASSSPDRVDRASVQRPAGQHPTLRRVAYISTGAGGLVFTRAPTPGEPACRRGTLFRRRPVPEARHQGEPTPERARCDRFASIANLRSAVLQRSRGFRRYRSSHDHGGPLGLRAAAARRHIRRRLLGSGPRPLDHAPRPLLTAAAADMSKRVVRPPTFASASGSGTLAHRRPQIGRRTASRSRCVKADAHQCDAPRLVSRVAVGARPGQLRAEAPITDAGVGIGPRVSRAVRRWP